MRLLSGPLLLCFAGFGQTSIQQFADLGSLTLENGDIMRAARVGYRTFGALNAQRSNAVLFPTWFTGRSEDLAGLIGPDKLVDSSRFFVIAVDALGNGVSTSPSNGGPAVFTIRDMVNTQHRLLTKHLGISHLHAVIGISMGGMQTFEWMAAYPGFMDVAVPIIGSPRLSSADLLLWQAELSVIETIQKCRCDPRLSMEAVGAIHQFALYTPEYRGAQTPREKFGVFKAALADTRMTPADWAAQLRAMMSHDVGAANGGSLEEAAKRVQAKTLIVVSRQDHMVDPLPAMRFGDRVRARVLELTGNCGHMATSCESGVMTPVVREFLAGAGR